MRLAAERLALQAHDLIAQLKFAKVESMPEFAQLTRALVQHQVRQPNLPVSAIA